MKTLATLPFEVMGEIVLAFCDINAQESPHSMFALLKVSQISGRWRAIAHHITALWTHIALDFHTHRQYDHIREQVAHWVVRSHPRSLVVTIRSCYPGQHNPIIDFVLAHAGAFPLLKTLTWTVMAKAETVYDPSLGVSRSDYFSHPGSYLRSGRHGILWETAGPNLTVFATLPRLQNITIHSNDNNDFDASRFTISWANLTHIDLGIIFLSVHDTAYLLPLCLNAEVLRFATSDDDVSTPTPPSPSFTLPLISLEWRGFDDVDAIPIFEPLTLPHLTSLTLRESCQEALHSLHDRSSFALQHLFLCVVDLTLSYLFTVLRSMPSLTVLELHYCLNISDALLTFLAYTGDDPIVASLTKLVMFDVVQCFDELELLRMVDSRWRATPLTQIDIVMSRLVPPASSDARVVHNGVLARIAELKAEGLKFRYEIETKSGVVEIPAYDDPEDGP
ncbi:hypothetical protein C8R46DRAFT_1349300 [Mycena filopes]|nr:hypothetical protein C8R46DRAFT_1349300 [Mycena filopes]